MAMGLFTALGQAASDGKKPQRPNIWLCIIMVVALVLFMLGFVITAYASEDDFPLSLLDLSHVERTIQCGDGVVIFDLAGGSCIHVYKKMDFQLGSMLYVRIVPSCSCEDIGGGENG